MGDQRRARAKPRGGGGGFATGMSATNNDDVKMILWRGDRHSDRLQRLFHVKHSYSFPDAETRKNSVENILNIDCADNPPQRP
jgi:hypothetical protein